MLDDDTYRLLLRAKIGANHWDGTLETSAAILNQIFQGGTHVLIEDNGDMSVDIGRRAAFGAVPGPADRGYIPIKPEGVRIKRAPLGRGPLFGFDVQNQHLGVRQRTLGIAVYRLNSPVP